MEGFYIKDVGTNTDVTGRDSFAFLRDITKSVCEQINKGLGIAVMPVSKAVDYDVGSSAGTGEATYDAGNNTYDDGTGAFACVNMAVSYYHYYHALIEQ